MKIKKAITIKECQYCGKKFKFSGNLSKHVKIDHQNIETNPDANDAWNEVSQFLNIEMFSQSDLHFIIFQNPKISTISDNVFNFGSI